MTGAVLLYILLYRSRVVPRFISVWGFLAVAALAMTMVFDIPDLTQTFEPAMLLYLPIVANELFLAGWLLVRGFQAETTPRVPERPARSEALVG